MHKLNMTPWKQKTLAAAAMLALAGLSFDASALALGAVTVHSHLGEPLRAEIEVPQISEAEAKTLQTALGSPQAFQAAGVEYNPAVANLRITLNRRKNGQAYLRLVGSRPVTEPFLGVVIESSWSNGRVVRDYTMLIDPADPGVRSGGQASEPEVSVSRNVRIASRAERTSSASSSRSARAAATAGSGDTVTVRRGDTAYGIVSALAPEGVSLDQMLVALQKANPHAFIRGNVNLLKAGAVLNVPTADEASAVSRKAARRAIVAQSRDFRVYRSGLAGHAPRAATTASSRSDSGRVQAHVQEPRSRQASGDNLILTPSRGRASVQSEERIAQNRQLRENMEREAELKRNIDQLKSLQQAAADSPSSARGSNGAEPTLAPQVNIPAPAVEPQQQDVPLPPPAEPLAPPAVETPTPPVTPEPAVEPPPAPVEPPPAPQPAPAPAPVEEEASLVDSLFENPLIPGVGLGVLALLAGFGVYRMRQTKKKTIRSAGSNSAESGGLQPDSFFHSSGSRVDSRNASGSSSSNTGLTSMAYSPSQLDAAGDVDPVAEADVYLAYGRDFQAEEILREALLTHPTRVSIHRKLAEIYAKRHDVAALEEIAIKAHALTEGRGSDWDAICVLGNEIDASNGLYKPGGKPGAPRVASAPAAPSAEPVASAHNFGADTAPQAAQKNAPPAVASSNEQTKEQLSASLASSGPSSVVPALDSTIDFDLDVDLDSITPPPAPAEKASDQAGSSASSSSGMIEFDIDALSLDPDSRGAELNTEQPEDADDDPLATKLALAQEFHSIGDTEGARLMAKEVVAEATGALKIRAERFLREIS